MNLTPSQDEMTQSAQIRTLISDTIAQNGGAIPFSKYMELALYSPNLGYYSGTTNKLGDTGDFTTAPEISPLFGATLCRTIKAIYEGSELSAKPIQILEFGAGTGKLAASILDELNRLDISVGSYQILDLSADLIDRQKQTLANHDERIEWLTQLPQNFRGIFLANEVLDAMPVDLITKHQDAWHYKNVTLDPTGRLALSIGDLVPHDYIPKVLLQNHFIEGYTTEIHLNGKAWIKTLGDVLDCGALLTIDYGFGASEYFHPQRSQGTLMLHYKHHAVQDPFFMPGICDITSHVDWSEIAQTAHESGLKVLGYTNQAAYLLDAGIGELALEYGNPNHPESFLKISNGLQKLLSEAEMGELFKVLCLGKSLSFEEGELPGFRGRPRSL